VERPPETVERPPDEGIAWGRLEARVASRLS